MMMNQQGSWVLIVGPTSLRLTKRHLGSAGKWKISPVEIETRSLLTEMEMVDKQNPCIPAEEAIATDRNGSLDGEAIRTLGCIDIGEHGEEGGMERRKLK